MSRIRHGSMVVTITVASAMILNAPQPAVASSPADETIAAIAGSGDAIEVVSGAAPLDDAVAGAVVGETMTVDTGTTEVVVDMESVVITLEDDEATVDIVIADAHGPADVSSQGFAVAETGDDASTAVLPQEDAVQLLTVIEGPAAPTSYSYEMNVPEGCTLSLDEAGQGVVVTDAEGLLVAALAPAWAVDAAGAEVATRFEVHGTSVVQVVDHTAAAVQYPVTADPYLGTNLFSYVRTDAALTVASVRLSTWGMSVWLRGGRTSALLPLPIAIYRGQAIINEHGWPEMLERMSTAGKRIFNRTTIQQQFACHALGWIADYRGWEWNLERVRPALSVHWTTNVLNHRCNWNSSNGGI